MNDWEDPKLSILSSAVFVIQILCLYLGLESLQQGQTSQRERERAGGSEKREREIFGLSFGGMGLKGS